MSVRLRIIALRNCLPCHKCAPAIRPLSGGALIALIGAGALFLGLVGSIWASSLSGPVNTDKSIHMPTNLELERIEPFPLAPEFSRRAAYARAIVVRPNQEPSVVFADLYLPYEGVRVIGDTAALLAEMAGVLDRERSWSVQVEAHCDKRGSEAYTLVVGDRQAAAVKEKLHSMGVATGQTTSVSYGAEGLLCTDQTGSCWEDNLRLQLSFEYLALNQKETSCLARLKMFAPSGISRAVAYSRQSAFLHRIQPAQ